MTPYLLIGAAGLAGLAGAWFVSERMVHRIIAALAVVGAVAAYMVIGRPDMPDQPLSKRIAAIQAQADKDAETLNAAEIYLLIEQRAKANPKDPAPHKFMGDILHANGRGQEAMLAYQAALRRDPNFAPAIESLADVRFLSEGAVDETTTRLYKRAFELSPQNLRVGYMAAIGDFQAGRKDEARAEWDRLEAMVGPGDPRAQMFKALRETFGTDNPPEPSPK